MIRHRCIQYLRREGISRNSGRGLSDLYRIYNKRLENGRDVIRLEHQEYPDQQLYDAILAKIVQR